MSVESITDCLHLGNSVYYHEPNTLPPPKNDDPSLVVLFTWLGGATTRRVNKYVAKYRTLYPHTAILLVRTVFADMAYRSLRTIHQRLAPARRAIEKVMAGYDSRQSLFRGALLHIMSISGCNMAIQFMLSLQQEACRLPVRAMIMDCAPGVGSFSKMYQAAAYSLPEGTVTQFTGRALLVPFVASVLTLQNTGIKASISDMRSQLNDPSVFPTDIKRLYLYSNADLIIEREDIEAHISDARAKGYHVESVLFEDSGHCAILNKWGQRYGATITNFWSSTNQDKTDRVSAATSDAQTNKAILRSKL